MPTPVSATDTVRNTGGGLSLAVSTRGPIVLHGAGAPEASEPLAGSAAAAAASAAEAAASSAAVEIAACSVTLPPAGVNLHALDRRLKLHGHV